MIPGHLLLACYSLLVKGYRYKERGLLTNPILSRDIKQEQPVDQMLSLRSDDQFILHSLVASLTQL